MLLIDTGIFISAADRNEPRHPDCATLLRNRSDLAVTASVIPEAAWLWKVDVHEVFTDVAESASVRSSLGAERPRRER